MSAGDRHPSLLGRIVRPADYVRVLATPLRLRSPHFAIHYLEGRPLPSKRVLPRPARPAAASEAAAASDAPVTASLSTELSTAPVAEAVVDVDDSSAPGAASDANASSADASGAGQAGAQRWLGLVVPKKHARRAVTRVLVKRQIRHIAADCASRLAPGLWVVRQRSPFDAGLYPSAASDALKKAARDELRALFERAARGERDHVKPRPPSAAGSAKARNGRDRPRAATGPASAAAAVSVPAAPAVPVAEPRPPASPEGSPCAA